MSSEIHANNTHGGEVLEPKKVVDSAGVEFFGVRIILIVSQLVKGENHL